VQRPFTLCDRTTVTRHLPINDALNGCAYKNYEERECVCVCMCES